MPEQTTTGWRRVLSIPFVYNAVQRVFGSDEDRQALFDEYLAIQPGERVLDIGCGTCRILDYLPDVDYYGFDANPAYIEAASKKYAGRGTFLCANVTEESLSDVPPFDVVLGMSILHHLNDENSVGLFRLAKSALRPGGRVITLDPGYTSEQGFVSRMMLGLDRGRHVRRPAAYGELAEQVFPNVTVHVDHRVLFPQIFVECRDAAADATQPSRAAA